MAAVVGEEYPGWPPRLAVYGLASTISGSRILAYQHFPSGMCWLRQRNGMADRSLRLSAPTITTALAGAVQSAASYKKL